MGKRGPEKRYPVRLNSVTTREQCQAVQEYAKRHGLRWGEAVRELIDLGLSHESDIKQAYGQGHADRAGPKRYIYVPPRERE